MKAPPGGWTAHEGLVGRIAYRYARAIPSLDIDDLMQQGRLGLMRAAQEWDPERGAWSTCAHFWIRSYVSRYVSNQARLVRVPVHRQAQLYSAGELYRERLAQLDQPIGGESDEGLRLHDVIPDGGETPEDHLVSSDLRAELRVAMADLPAKHRIAIRLRLAGLTLKEIGAELDRSRERIRQLETEAVAYLTAAVRGDYATARRMRSSWRRARGPRAPRPTATAA